MADVLMPGIHAVTRDLFTKLMTKVTVVVQKRGYDDDRRLASLLGEGRALQCVLELCHVLSVMAMALFTIGSQDVVEVVWIHGAEC